MASKRKRPTESIHDRDRIIVRLPDGMRDQLAKTAEANGRSVTAEVVAAIEKHLESADRVTQIWETLKKHQRDIEDIELIRQAVLSLESAMGPNFYGVLRTDFDRRKAEMVAKLPPISAEQAAHIRALIKETDAPEAEDWLLQILNASRIEEIKEYERALYILEGVARRAKDRPT